MVEIRAASSIHACNIIGWQPRRVHLVAETEIKPKLKPQPMDNQYSWWSFRANARNNNKGWRIDYINVSQSLKDKIHHAEILPSIKHSDHCPVALKLNI